MAIDMRDFGDVMREGRRDCPAITCPKNPGTPG